MGALHEMVPEISCKINYIQPIEWIQSRREDLDCVTSIILSSKSTAEMTAVCASCHSAAITPETDACKQPTPGDPTTSCLTGKDRNTRSRLILGQ